MPPPVTASGKIVLESLTGLSKELRFYAEGFKATRKLKAAVAEIDQIKKGISSVTQSTKDLEKQFKGGQKVIDTLNKDVKEGKKLWDKFLSKIPGGASDLVKAAKASTTLGSFLAIGGVAAIVALIAKYQGEINDAAFATDEFLQGDLTKVNALAVKVGLRVKSTNKKVEELVLSDQRTRDRVYALEKEKPAIATDITKAKKDANDALYEVRQGRVKLDARIDKLRDDYVAFKVKAEKAIKGIDTNFQKATNTAITKLQTGLEKATTAITTANTTIKTANNTILSQGGLIKTLQTDVGKLLKNLATVPKTVPDVAKTIVTEVAKATTGLKVAIDQKIAQTDQSTRQYVERKITDVTYAERTYVRETIIRPVLATVTATTGTIAEVNRKVETNIAAVRTLDNRIDKAALRDDITTITIDRTAGQIKKLQVDVDTTNAELSKTKASLITIDTKIKEQDKVNAEGNKKLDQLFPLVSGLPLVVGRAEQNIINKLPTPEGLANAAATGICRSTQPGGCMNKALNDNANDIKTNANNNAGAVLDAVNTGANAALLAGQETILTRLGAQVPGGISGFMNRIVKNEWVDRAINLVTMTAAVHNVVMLSDAATTTFFGILDNVLAIPALIVDPNAETIDTKQAFGGVVDGFFKGIFGVTEWAQIKARWNTVNRIYQAGANGINEVRSIGGNIIGAVEQTARLTGKGFNAMQDEGLLSESNWDYSPENLKLKGGLFAKFGKLADGINIATEGLEAIESITSEIRSAVDSANQIKENAKEVDDGLKELFTQSKTQREAEVEALPAKSYSWEDLI